MSRVKKFKEYRNSLQNNSEDVLTTQTIDITKDIDDERLKTKKPNTESLSTLSVSYEEIMKAANKVDEQNEISAKQDKTYKLKRNLKICGAVFVCLAVIGAIVAIGIILF